MAETAPTVFVVDNDISVRRALARLMRSVGMQVETFASARAFLGCQLPDGLACLVLDVWLPGESGLALQEALRTAARRLPIIFLSGHGTIPICVQAFKAGAVDFLQKPCDEQHLLEAVATALDLDRRTQNDWRKRVELQQRLATLTSRERDVMALVVTGMLNKQIAALLGTGEKTVKVQRARAMQKMQATSLAEFVRMADTLGLHQPPAASRRLPRAQEQVKLTLKTRLFIFSLTLTLAAVLLLDIATIARAQGG